jgi:hypothetical protein
MRDIGDSIKKYMRSLWGPGQFDDTRSYDFGDRLMRQRKFAEAEHEYRKYLAKDPMDLGALLRVAQAIAADERFEDAIAELADARRKSIERQDDSDNPSNGWVLARKDYRQHRIMTLSFVMGDLFVEKLDDIAGAKKLYAETLEVLYGYPDVNPLRERLKALENPNRLSLNEAVEKLQPEKIPFPEE